MDKKLKLISLKNSLSQVVKTNEIVSLICEKLATFKDNKYKADPHLILHIVTCIENVVDKKDKIDKTELAVKIFTTLFDSCSQDEVRIYLTIIEFLLDRKQIKKIKPEPVATPGLLAKRKPKIQDDQIFEMKREIKKK